MSDQLKRLIDERASVWEDAKKIIDKADAEDRGFTAEEKQEYERYDERLTELSERIDIGTERMTRDREADEYRAQAEAFIRPSEDVRHEPNADERALDWFRSGSRGALEVPLRAGAYESRDLVTGTAAGAGDTVFTTFSDKLYEHLIENSGIRQTRVTVINTASGEPFVFAKTTAHTGAGTIVAEAAAINEDDPTVGRGTLNAYKYAKLVQLSSEMVSDTGVDLLGYLARSFGQALANGSGAHFVTGTGSSQPNGVITGGSLAVTGGTGVSGIPTADELIDLFYSIKEPYAANGEWLMRRATVGKIRKLKDTTNQYLWQPSLVVGSPETILGHPVRIDPNVPATGTVATSVAFGDFSHYLIRDVGSLRFERSDDFAFGNDLITYRVILRTDGDYTDTTGAIVTYKGGTA